MVNRFLVVPSTNAYRTLAEYDRTVAVSIDDGGGTAARERTGGDDEHPSPSYSPRTPSNSPPGRGGATSQWKEERRRLVHTERL